jgi:VWFA-related protein
MQFRRVEFALALVALAAGVVAAQDAPQTSHNTGTSVVRTESRLVQVDTVVTDRKGNPIRNITPREFHVFEDNQEQSIKSVTQESPASEGVPSYFVLFFGKMKTSELVYAREKAVQFIEANASPKRLIAIANYLDTGNVKLTQSFTSDAARLKQAAAGMKTTGVIAESTIADHTGEVFAGSQFGVGDPASSSSETGEVAGRSLLYAVSGIAKGLASLNGHKALIMIAPTFDYSLQQHDFPATISACNRANVAVYSIDVRGNSDSMFQNTLYPLFDGTGGFATDNPNDMPRALRRIVEDQEERYVITYSPSKSPEESCHTLKVIVEHPGAKVRARSEYCNVKANDPLAGTALDRNLEGRASGATPGNMPARMQVAFFYGVADTAHVDVAAEISAESLKFEKQNNKLHSALNVLGVAYKPDGTVGARFTDIVGFEFDNKDQVDQFKRQSYQYEKQFDITPGRYLFELVFSPGASDFAKLETPLVVDSRDSNHLAISGLVLCREFRSAADRQDPGAALFSDRVPLVSRGTQFVPSGTTRFRKTDTAGVYFELYEPRQPPTLQASLQFRLRVFERTGGELKSDSQPMSIALSKWKDPTIPIGLKLAIDKLPPGSYRLEVNASDASGGAPLVRSAEFEVE